MKEVDPMDYLVTLIIAVVGSSGIASVVVACLNRHWSKQDKGVVTKADLEEINKKIDALTENQKVTSIDRIKHLVRVAITDGYIDLDDKEMIVSMYNSYKSLGGNGHLETAMKELDKLPVKDGNTTC